MSTLRVADKLSELDVSDLIRVLEKAAEEIPDIVECIEKAVDDLI